MARGSRSMRSVAAVASDQAIWKNFFALDDDFDDMWLLPEWMRVDARIISHQDNRTPDNREPIAQHCGMKQRAPGLCQGLMFKQQGSAYRLTWRLVPPPGAPVPGSPLETTL